MPSPGVCRKPVISIHAAEAPRLQLSKRCVQRFPTVSSALGGVGGGERWGEGRGGNCGGATHDGAGVDVVGAALAALRLQGDPGVIV